MNADWKTEDRDQKTEDRKQNDQMIGDFGLVCSLSAGAFGCNPNTMRAHDITLDETPVSDEVLNALARRMRPTTSSPPPDVPKAG